MPIIPNNDIRIIPPHPARHTHIPQPPSRRIIRPELRHIRHANAIILAQNLQISRLAAGALFLRDPDIDVGTRVDFPEPLFAPIGRPDVLLVFVERDDGREGPVGFGEAGDAVEAEHDAHHGVGGLLLWGDGVDVFVGELVGQEVGGAHLGAKDAEDCEDAFACGAGHLD